MAREGLLSDLESNKLFTQAIGTCNEGIKILLGKPVDEELLSTVNAHLCRQLEEATNLLQASSSELIMCGGVINPEVQEVLSTFYKFHKAYFLGML